MNVQDEIACPIVEAWLSAWPVPSIEAFPQLPFAPRAKRVIEIALEEANGVGRSRIAPEHVLLGILGKYKECPPHGGGAARQLKEELQVNLQKLEQQLRTTIKQPSSHN